ncbi:hypothetical protein [Halostagnicola sp. A-GB9-2]|uniref:hypothetical protein n=1 Tax=Halostagnicola sp. A-GB9-2 TaxID=3048066 RepID=UPI0024C03698|nr:hypothetical protein [Halostagnicola sp. A-GB9-2]MDJ1431984.1 hypothetical protein [Halostagnicola sp. A-GB9-2]
MAVKSKEIAEYLSAPHKGPVVYIEDVNDISRADNNEMSFYIGTNLDELESSAGVIICSEGVAPPEGMTTIQHSDPQFAFLKAVKQYFKQSPNQTKIHSSAVVESGAEIGEQCLIGPNVYIGSTVEIGDQCRIGAGTTIGGDPVGIVEGDDYEMYRHKYRGGVEVGNQVEIGQNCCINRSVFNNTIIGEECILDDQIHVGHRVNIKPRVWISCNVTLGGRVTIEEGARINPAAAIGQYVNIGEGATVGMNSTVLDDVPAEAKVVGTPASRV